MTTLRVDHVSGSRGDYLTTQPTPIVGKVCAGVNGAVLPRSAGTRSLGRCPAIASLGSIAITCRSGGSYEPVPAPTLTTVRLSPSAARIRSRAQDPYAASTNSRGDGVLARLKVAVKACPACWIVVRAVVYGVGDAKVYPRDRAKRRRSSTDGSSSRSTDCSTTSGPRTLNADAGPRRRRCAARPRARR